VVSHSQTFAPLADPGYRRLFAIGLLTYLATWMQSVGATWLMTSLTGSPLWVGLVSTAISLPMFLLALPAGVLADLADRRHLIMGTQATMLLAMALLVALLAMDALGPTTLLAATLLLGVAAAMHAPAWNATLGETVPHAQMHQALTLNGMAFNAARTIGPALAGALIAALGTAWVFGLNALAYAAVLLVISRWRPPQRLSHLPPERLWGGVLSAVRYFRHAPELPGYLLRLGLFVLAGASLLTLLPLVAQQDLQMGAGGFGLLMGAFGVGGVAGALVQGRVRARLGSDQYLRVATLVLSAGLAAVAFVHVPWVVFVALFLAGSVWVNAITEVFAAMSTSVPNWIRGRTAAFHLLTTQGAIAAGGVLWGAIANAAGVSSALAVASALMLASLALARRIPLRMGSERDVLPGRVVDLPEAIEQPEADAGPVAVEVVYRIPAEMQAAFIEAAEGLGAVRRRNGASVWRLYRDLSEPERLVERFIVASWVDYQRQRARWTQADERIEQEVREFQAPAVPISSAHYVAER
jgi:MFS family permease